MRRIISAIDHVAIWHVALDDKYVTDLYPKSEKPPPYIPSGSPVDPYYMTGLHEIGHALDFQGEFAASEAAPAALRKLWIQQGRPFHTDKATTPLDQRHEHPFNQWLRSELSGYGFYDKQGQPNYGGKFNAAEALGQAFADVETNANPSDASKLLHKMVLDESLKAVPRRRPPVKTQFPTQYLPMTDPQGRPHPNMEFQVPKGFHQAVDDMAKKYPHLDINNVKIDPTQQGAIAFTHALVDHYKGRDIPKVEMGIDPRFTIGDALAQQEQYGVDRDLIDSHYNDPTYGPTTTEDATHYLDEMSRIGHP